MDGRVAAMAEAVDACATLPLLPLDPAECVDVLDAVVAAERRLGGLKLRLIHRIDAAEVAKKQGATSTAVWLRGRYRMAIGTAANSSTPPGRFAPARPCCGPRSCGVS
jgi:hypothetical protein